MTMTKLRQWQTALANAKHVKARDFSLCKECECATLEGCSFSCLMKSFCEDRNADLP